MQYPRVLFATLTALLVVLSACTGEPPAPTVPSAPSAPSAPAALPDDVFPGLPDAGPGTDTDVEAMAGDRETLVMVATVHGRASFPVLRYSTDAGSTWRDGVLTPAAAAASVVGEEAIGVAAVASSGALRQWLVLGSADRALFAWTSPDGQLWERTPISGIDPDQGDEVSSVAGCAGGGFVAVGGRLNDEEGRSAIWTSPDGITWTAQKSPVKGWLDAVASSGDRVVATGYRTFAEVTKGRSQKSLLLTSVDRGATWREVAVREPATSGNFVSYLDHAVATSTGFMVGGAYYDGRHDNYRPFLLSSSGVGSWRIAPRLPDAGESSEIDELLQLDTATVAVQRSRSSSAVDELRVHYLFGGEPGWTPAEPPQLTRSAWISAAAAAGDTAVLAVGVEGNPRQRRVWRFDGPSQVQVSEIAPPPGLRDPVEPERLLIVDGKLGAYGLAQGKPAWWASDAGTFGVPRSLPIGDEEVLERIAWSPDAGFLAIGRRADRDAFTMRSADGTTWTRTDPAVFNRVARYHWSVIHDVIRTHGRWVVVGARSTNGSVRRSGLVSTSTDGRSWRPGRPTKAGSRGDWYGRRDPLDDLHGLDNRGRELNAVVGVGGGLVGVGETGASDRPRPAAWVAPSGYQWRLLPLASAGYPDASVTSVSRVGGVLLGLGSARAKDAQHADRAVWRSGDDGRRWSFRAFPGRYEDSRIATTDREFLQVVLADDHRTLTLSRSADGQSWTESSITVGGLGEGIRVGLLDALVHDGALHLLLTLTTRQDAVTFIQRVPL